MSLSEPRPLAAPSRRWATLVNEERLGALADLLAAVVPSGAFLALSGELGAGKTTFVKRFAAALGIDPAEVVSPTFGLIHEHAGPHGRLVHADLYRLAHVADLGETGWDDAVRDASYVCVEWPERVAPALPADRIEIELRCDGPESRTVLVAGHGAAAAAIDRLPEPLFG